ncbi:hypothetical protein AQJ11_14475 [Streptomyces corchorusii]|uniref:Uncharacterized protein n=2 Tax=Streptomyces TaxID=1883 RepID=A0A101QDG7_STRCK|nr:hypothetical protein [Streptomyces corchorusii]KUN27815.1 hypothetical protein AQJ11_14475 [Streptomyces corchorusii]
MTLHSTRPAAAGSRRIAVAAALALVLTGAVGGAGTAFVSAADPAAETPSSMARRTGAVAGINGDYVEIHASGRPLGGIVSDGHMLKSPKPGFASQLGVRPEGTMVMGPETFSDTVTAGSATRSLTSVNTVNDVSTGGITEVTPDLGETPDLAKPSTLVAPADQGGISHFALVRIGDDGGLP